MKVTRMEVTRMGARMEVTWTEVTQMGPVTEVTWIEGTWMEVTCGMEVTNGWGQGWR